MYRSLSLIVFYGAHFLFSMSCGGGGDGTLLLMTFYLAFRTYFFVFQSLISFMFNKCLECVVVLAGGGWAMSSILNLLCFASQWYRFLSFFLLSLLDSSSAVIIILRKKCQGIYEVVAACSREKSSFINWYSVPTTDRQTKHTTSDGAKLCKTIAQSSMIQWQLTLEFGICNYFFFSFNGRVCVDSNLFLFFLSLLRSEHRLPIKINTTTSCWMAFFIFQFENLFNCGILVLDDTHCCGSFTYTWLVTPVSVCVLQPASRTSKHFSHFTIRLVFVNGSGGIRWIQRISFHKTINGSNWNWLLSYVFVCAVCARNSCGARVSTIEIYFRHDVNVRYCRDIFQFHSFNSTVVRCHSSLQWRFNA